MQMIKYNGNMWTWAEFKKYWGNKTIGGWLFDDLKEN
jgi:hypothetical protein